MNFLNIENIKKQKYWWFYHLKINLAHKSIYVLLVMCGKQNLLIWFKTKLEQCYIFHLCYFYLLSKETLVYTKIHTLYKRGSMSCGKCVSHAPNPHRDKEHPLPQTGLGVRSHSALRSVKAQFDFCGWVSSPVPQLHINGSTQRVLFSVLPRLMGVMFGDSSVRLRVSVVCNVRHCHTWFILSCAVVCLRHLQFGAIMKRPSLIIFVCVSGTYAFTTSVFRTTCKVLLDATDFNLLH